MDNEFRGINDGTKEKKIVNLTSYDVEVEAQDGTMVVFPAISISVRFTVSDKKIGSIQGVPIMERRFFGEELLPPPKPNTYYIVTRTVANYALIKGIERDDLLVAETRRDKGNKVFKSTKFFIYRG